MLVVSGMFLAVVYGESPLVAGIDILVVGRLLIWTLYWMLLVEVTTRNRRSLARLMAGFFLALRGISCVFTNLLHYMLPAGPVFAIGSYTFMVRAEIALRNVRRPPSSTSRWATPCSASPSCSTRRRTPCART